MGFVHLHCHTQYSLLDGAIRIHDLVSKTQSFGQEAVAVTDHGVLYGAMEFYDKAKKVGIKPIIGCEIYVAPGDMKSREQIPGMPKNYHLVLLAQDETGYRNLIRLVSMAHVDGFYYKPRVDRAALSELNKGLIALSACLQGEIPYWLLRGNEERANDALEFYSRTFEGRFYLEIQANGLADQETVNPQLVELGRRRGIPVVATNDCHYLLKSDAKAHEALLCIQTQTTLHDKGRMSFETDELYLKSPQEMEAYFHWVPEAVDASAEVAGRCSLELPRGEYYFPVYPTEDGKSLEDLIHEKAWAGLKARMGDHIPEEYARRLEEELGIIRSMGFSGYFLIVADYIQYAKANDIPVGPGRGSAAGSLAAYGLGITDIDPIRWNLLFERFLNPERKSMPDIDVDFCQSRRDEVIEYVKNKYGPQYVCQITTFGNMKAKAVIRDVGRVLGMSYGDVDRIAKLIPNDLHMTLDEALKVEPRLRQLMDSDPMVSRLIDIARSLEGLSRHASVHAGGVVISDSRPLVEHIPVYMDKKGMLISQYDMKRIEQVGLIKLDMLGLKTLTVIQKACQILKGRGIDLDIANLPLDDKATYDLISDGDTSSVFQLESSGMKQMLKRLKPEKFEDIIAAVALYRPGPMDLIPSYTDRKHGREKIEYPHPLLEPILRETYGIIVYQEQVMQIAQKLAGYSLGKADLLRRAMGKKIAAEMAEHRGIFVEGAVKNGVVQQVAVEIFDLMEKFANYGFNKSHAAAYALVAYQTAYLKAHHFREFMAANLTLDLGNTDKVTRHLSECKANGVPILCPDINESSWEFITTDEGIRFGLAGIKNVGRAAVEVMLKERERGGKFTDIGNFLERIALTKVNRRVIESLIQVGAFDSLHANRRALLESLDALLDEAQRKAKDRLAGQETLFSLEEFSEDNASDSVELPDIPDFSENEKLKMEKENVGFYISGHPLKRYTSLIEKYATATTRNLPDTPGIVIMAGVLNEVNVTRTKKGSPMARGYLEDLEGSAPVVFFPQCFSAYQDVIKDNAVVVVKARINGTEDGAGQENDNPQVDLIAEEVYPIDQAQSVLARRIILRLPPCTGSDDIRALKETISDSKGTCQICFEISTDEGIVLIDAGREYMVTPSRDVVTRLGELLGASSVELQ
ncbi:MAG: DNA polymerase III subunit alpha [Deltaproteobacteria bacterium ADurb.BinA179]|mgnify:FL=1|jgi:DNA polymerase-3 subunit alpha|nr:MAG: DNA polymerase III subunit alpha [Deltaproteobacteria bacterium ADurb.BinA179]HOD70120.1 DNA polymerase III subunit alpha [Deltaproteobacteria bacterium]HOE71835.1 DNA polymerase III subunit alpha [Deltaproteobacteria bacterium]HOS26355.1 DNA polymerase III subunit alpha [Deltaproteobacteria bacterium]HPV30852.1 DNA polymerase III subunit alpha [Deltaproteobacteria bacterium]